MTHFQTKYGYFTEEGDEYIISRPDTPKPWVNVICPGDYGLVVSQTGGGFSWKTHASLNRITRWEQDMIKDEWGKFIYLKDEQNGDFWSLTWKPVCVNYKSYQIIHGMGYSRFVSKNNNISAEMTMFIPKSDPVEIWDVYLKNESSEEKIISLFSYFEWGLGIAPDSHREFHKTFIETEIDLKTNTLWATKRLWELPNTAGQHWNRDWEYFAFHSVNEKIGGYEGDKEKFIGMYGSLREPIAVQNGKLNNTCGKWGDAIGSLHNRIVLKPGEIKRLVYLLGAVARDEKSRAESLIRQYQKLDAVDEAFKEVKQFWKKLLSATKIQTPDTGFNIMNNFWLKYQAISGRLWGRTGYYQTGGAYGFRDQLQDSQIFLSLDPKLTGEQIKLHAAHQFSQGNVNHWWHPLSEEGKVNRISDNLLWLPFITVKYLKETGQFSFLDELVPFKDENEASIYDHCCRAIDYSLTRRSQRGLPLIGDGDWNDGLNAVGSAGKGESIWLGEFLCGVLRDFAVVAEKMGERSRAELYRSEAVALKDAVNRYAWDGDWYIRAVCDNGEVLGSKDCKDGKIFLNAQSWAILNDIADQERVQKVFQSMDQYLLREYGPLLLYPAYHEPNVNIGYLSRYAPGLRENGGLYTHAGTWAVLAACKLGYHNKAYRIYKSFMPPYRGMDPELYQVEPYVTPGNVDGPDSPNFGRGGWTWYTGSAAWMYTVAMEGILGIYADWNGLTIKPSIPDEWDSFLVTRPYQGATYQISLHRTLENKKGDIEVIVDGEKISGNIVKPHHDGLTHHIEVIV